VREGGDLTDKSDSIWDAAYLQAYIIHCREHPHPLGKAGRVGFPLGKAGRVGFTHLSHLRARHRHHEKEQNRGRAYLRAGVGARKPAVKAGKSTSKVERRPGIMLWLSVWCL